MERVSAGSLSLSRLGLGTRSMGGSLGYGHWERVVHQALDAGVSYIDTSPGYGGGETHRLLGQILRGKRGEVTLGLQVGSPEVLDPVSIEEELKGSLKAMKTEWVDLLQLHYPDPRADYDEIKDFLLRLRQDGLIREFGVSNFHEEELCRWPKESKPRTLQIAVNLLQRGALRKAAAEAAPADVRVIAHTPLLAGVLSWPKGEEETPGLKGAIFQSLDQTGRDLLARLGEIARETGFSPSQIALGWVLDQPGVSAALVGARTEAQLAESLEVPRHLGSMREGLAVLSQMSPREPVIPLKATVLQIVEERKERVLCRLEVWVGERPLHICRWLPAQLGPGTDLIWNGLSDRPAQVMASDKE